MKMMQRLLNNLSSTWHKVPKDRPVFTLARGEGVHFLVTIETGQLHLHTMMYHQELPVKQSIALDNLTLSELAGILRGMGYTFTWTSEDPQFTERKASGLMHVRNRPIAKGQGCEFTVFTARVWEMLYPIARLLELTEQDVELAIQQMYTPSARGTWVDYWASFFNIKRMLNEDDTALIKRMGLLLMNPKTNNRSMEEMLKFVLQLNVEITDFSPAIFQVTLPPDFMDVEGEESQIIFKSADDLIRAIKGAGFHYFYTFIKEMSEDYKAYVSDKTGIPWANLDVWDINASNVQLELVDVYDPTTIFDTYAFEMTSSDFVEAIETPLDVLATIDYGREYEDAWGSLKDEYDEVMAEFVETIATVQEEGTSEVGYSYEEMYDTVRQIVEEVLPFIQEVSADDTYTGYFELFDTYELGLEDTDFRLKLAEEGTSEVEHSYDELYVKIQEELAPFIHELIASEIFPQPLDPTVTAVLDIEPEDYRNQQGMMFTTNQSRLVGPHKLVYADINEVVTMILKDSRGRDIRNETYY